MKLFSMELLENVKCIKFLSETISSTRSITSLNFKYIEEGIVNNIKILVEEENDGIGIYIMYENICKNLDISDHIMDKMLIETSKICKKVKERILVTRKDVKVKLDTMNIKNSIYDKFRNIEKTDYIANLYEQIKTHKREYNNYGNKLIIFGTRGKEVSELIERLGLGKVRRTRSGYLIEFEDHINNTSNIFSTKFANGLNEVGISCLSMPLISIDYFWK